MNEYATSSPYKKLKRYRISKKFKGFFKEDNLERRTKIPRFKKIPSVKKIPRKIKKKTRFNILPGFHVNLRRQYFFYFLKSQDLSELSLIIGHILYNNFVLLS